MNIHSKKYNKKAYTNRMFRVHKGSDLDDRICAHMEEGHSLNWLITELLCEYFKVPIPHKVRFITTREPLCPGWVPRDER